MSYSLSVLLIFHLTNLSYGDSSTTPVFHPNRRTRILLSPDQGSGWITEAPRSASDAFLVWMLTYEPLVRALEHHERRGERPSWSLLDLFVARVTNLIL